LLSPTWTTEGPRLTRIIEDARVKYVMGEIDDAGWQAAVNSWRTGGGDKVLEEMTALYLAQNK
jgi:putative aldouronate transport system substrate-binding protein